MMSLGAVLLCGGESRRMGRSKAWLPFGPESLLQRVVRLVSSVAAPVVVVAAPEQSLPPLPEPVMLARDPVSGRGPLQGLATGLAAMPRAIELVYATATDVPFLQPAWPLKLADLIQGHELALPSCLGYDHPLAALYQRAPALIAVEEMLRGNQLRPVKLKDRLRTRIVGEAELRSVDPELQTLINLNNFAEYLRALKLAGYTPELPLPEAEGIAQPTIVIELFGVPRLRVGKPTIAVSAATVAEALARLESAAQGALEGILHQGELDPAYTLNLNGARFLSPSELHTQLQEGDRLLLLALDVGG
jgi:molybdopterin-guanine dinucleotide biosynthesis protein A